MTTPFPTKISIVGGGVIGGGWVARFSENGHDVYVFDPAPDSAQKIDAICQNAALAYAQLTNAPRFQRGNVHHATTLAEAVAGSQLIIEAVPERLDIKQKVYADIEQHALPDALICSSTSGILPTQLQQNLQYPQRLLVAHPFNPVYLLPLVELVGGVQTAPPNIERAAAIFSEVGMHPLPIKKEIEAFVADRLLEALWREALWLVHDNIATTSQIDDAIRYGFGLRWAQMGVFETYRVAGGTAGMRHFMEQFGPCLQWPWTKLTDVPDYNQALIDKIVTQSDAQSGAYDIRTLERIRDTNLVGILQVLKSNKWGAGNALAAHERKLYDKAPVTQQADTSQPLPTLSCRVPTQWLDYNNHMTESRYLQALSDATDGFLRFVGMDADYIAAVGAYFTAETNLRHLAEIKAGEAITATTQVIQVKDKKLHIYNRLFREDGTLAATGEHLLLHVGTHSRRSCSPRADLLEQLTTIAAAHAPLSPPTPLKCKIT